MKMQISKIKYALSFGLILLACNVIAAPTTVALTEKPCDSLTKTKTWQKTHKNLTSVFQNFTLDRQKRILTFEKNDVFSAITSNSDFQPLFEACYWMNDSFENAKSMIPLLIGLLTDSKIVGLTNSVDVIIWERMKELKFYGHGRVIGDDLFQVSGRASWLLKEITGENFGEVKPNSSESDLKKLQEKWSNWYRGFDCK